MIHKLIFTKNYPFCRSFTMLLLAAGILSLAAFEAAAQSNLR